MQVLNGVIKPRNIFKANSIRSRDENLTRGAINGEGEEKEEELMVVERETVTPDTEEGGERGERGEREEGCTKMNGFSDTVLEKMEVEDEEEREEEREGAGGGGEVKEEVPTPAKDLSISPGHCECAVSILYMRFSNEPTITAPDLSLLDPRLVQLLASQRLQQLFGSHNDEKTTGASFSSLHVKSINGMRSILSPQPTKPPLTLGKLLICYWPRISM